MTLCTEDRKDLPDQAKGTSGAENQEGVLKRVRQGLAGGSSSEQAGVVLAQSPGSPGLPTGLTSPLLLPLADGLG